MTRLPLKSDEHTFAYTKGGLERRKKLIQSRGDNMQLNLLLFPLSQQMCFGVAIPPQLCMRLTLFFLSLSTFLPKCYLWKFQTFHIRVEYCGGAEYTDIKYIGHKKGLRCAMCEYKTCSFLVHVYMDGVFVITLKMCVE